MSRCSAGVEASLATVRLFFLGGIVVLCRTDRSWRMPHGTVCVELQLLEREIEIEVVGLLDRGLFVDGRNTPKVVVTTELSLAGTEA